MDEFWTSSFWRDLNEGDINFRDNLQFELKSDFPLAETGDKTTFTQEFYLFVPGTLYINRLSYPKAFFYQDELTLIRYKTPKFTFTKLNTQSDSPLKILRTAPSERELKLLANIFRSTLRAKVRTFILRDTGDLSKQIATLVSEIEEFRAQFLSLKNTMPKNLELPFVHTDEFIVKSMEYYLCGLLDRCPREVDTTPLTRLLTECERYQTEMFPIEKRESVLHRNSLLTKYIMEVLQLRSTRVAVQEKHGAAIGAIAAGIAMFLYTTLFAIAFFSHTANPLITTSFPVILTVVLLYILKDRVKEGLKGYYQHRAYRWFPDYSTDILDPTGNRVGTLKETLQFLKSDDLPQAVKQIRHGEFHDELPDIKRLETVIKYKREVILFKPDPKADPRLKDLNTIFRFNVHHLIAKASDTLPLYFSFDPATNSVEKIRLPRVYHLNLIITSDETTHEKYRVVVDKAGIKRVEKL